MLSVIPRFTSVPSLLHRVAAQRVIFIASDPQRANLPALLLHPPALRHYDHDVDRSIILDVYAYSPPCETLKKAIL